MAERDPLEWEVEEADSGRPKLLTWVILFLLVCALLLPLLSPLIRDVQRALQPTPTQFIPANTV